MNETLEIAVEAWVQALVRVLNSTSGETEVRLGKRAEWRSFGAAEAGEWIVQRFSGNEATVWVFVPERSREIITHYVQRTPLPTVFTQVSEAFVESFDRSGSDAPVALRATASSEPGAGDGVGRLIEVELPVGSCGLGVVLNCEAISIVRPKHQRSGTSSMAEMEFMLDMELPITVCIGSTQLPLRDVLKLTTGSIVELDRLIGDPVDIMVSNHIIARGEVVVIEGNYGVRILEIVSRTERLRLKGNNRRSTGVTALAPHRSTAPRTEAFND